MTLGFSWRALGSALLDLFFPPRCAACGKDGAWFCATCLSSVTFVADEESGFPMLLPGGGLLAVHSVAYFGGALREAIHRFKYEGMRVLGAPFGEILHDYWRTHAISADVLIPVPLHQRRLRERGYNQSQILAEELARRVGLAVNATALRRIKDTVPQVQLNAQERQRNVAGAFHCEPLALAGHRVVLIDDVRTTGATLCACAEAVMAAGACSVAALTLAKAREGDDAVAR